MAQFLLLLFLFVLALSNAQPPEGQGCDANLSLYPCAAYAFFRAAAPDVLDLASVGDLFGTSRYAIAHASNLSSPLTAPLFPGQPLLLPLACSCSSNRSYAAVTYRINSGDTFFLVSQLRYQNLTTFEAVELANPNLVPNELKVGDEAVFPVFCRCPNRTQLNGDGSAAAAANASSIITYVAQPSDTFSSIASTFGCDFGALVSLNGGKIAAFSAIFVPVSEIPIDLTRFGFKQPPSYPSPPPPKPSPANSVEEKGKDGVIIGLGVVVGILGSLFLFAILALLLKNSGWRTQGEYGKSAGRRVARSQVRQLSRSDEGLMADIYKCLDKYKVYKIEELRQATSNFDAACVIRGSVFKGWIDGVPYAIKKMKWDACQELRILQKVNHTNLVKLEGFCIDPEDGTCYLVYEYVENGSLHSWLHESSKSKNLDWRRRLKIVLDLANGLQYIHEHTWPRVVHKDIKTSNVLLDGKMKAKIANFGLASSGCNAMTTHFIGTLGYIAPEYRADGLISTKMDVFAFGVVLLELVSGKEAVDKDGRALWADLDKVFNGSEGKGDGKLKEWMDQILVEQGCPMESVMCVMAVAKACLSRDPSRRPSMVDIVYMLSKADDLSDFSADALAVCSTDVAAR